MKTQRYYVIAWNKQQFTALMKSIGAVWDTLIGTRWDRGDHAYIYVGKAYELTILSDIDRGLGSIILCDGCHDHPFYAKNIEAIHEVKVLYGHQVRAQWKPGILSEGHQNKWDGVWINEPQLKWNDFTPTNSCASYSILYSLSAQLIGGEWHWMASASASSSDRGDGTAPTAKEAKIAAEQYVAKRILELPKLVLIEEQS